MAGRSFGSGVEHERGIAHRGAVKRRPQSSTSTVRISGLRASTMGCVGAKARTRRITGRRALWLVSESDRVRRSRGCHASLASREATLSCEYYVRNTRFNQANSHANGRNFGDSRCVFKMACISADSSVYAPILHSPYHAATSDASYPFDSLCKGSAPWVSSNFTIAGC